VAGYILWKREIIMDSEFIEAINTTADTSFDVTKTFGRNEIAKRPSGIVANGFRRPGERAECWLDRNNNPPEITNEPLPKYFRMHCTPNDEDKRGAWQLQAEYLEGRLGKNEEENGRLWNTVLWINKHYRVWRTPAEALPPLNIYVGDKISQSTEGTGAPAGPDDEAPDEVENEGFEFESINVGEADEQRNMMCVMGKDGTTYRLEIKTDDYAVMRLIDGQLEVYEQKVNREYKEFIA
jgi:hypothetical protein